jgi:hypothetical protein
MVRQHPIQPHNITLLDLPEAILAYPLCILFVLPAGMVGCDVDARMRLVPGRQVGVCLGADGAQGARDEVEDGADFGLAFCRKESALVGFRMMGWEGRGKRERERGKGGRGGRLTSGGEKHFYTQVRISDAHEDDVVGFVAFEIVVPEVACEFGHLCLQLCFVGTWCDSVHFVLYVSNY